MPVVIDDQTLAGVLREELEWPGDDVFTTGHWYLRLCQAVVRGSAGSLSGPINALPPPHRGRIVQAILELPERIDMLGWRVVAPVMANQLDGPGRRLNLLSREALAVATILNAEVVMARGNENRLLRDALDQVGLA